MIKFTITVDENQAKTISNALDFYTRICLGQFEEIENMIRMKRIPLGPNISVNDVGECINVARKVSNYIRDAKMALGHSPNGSWGIFYEKLPIAAKRCYEIQKVIDEAIAYSNDPDPEFRGVDYDGLWTRLTDDPAPICEEIK